MVRNVEGTTEMTIQVEDAARSPSGRFDSLAWDFVGLPALGPDTQSLPERLAAKKSLALRKYVADRVFRAHTTAEIDEAIEDLLDDPKYQKLLHEAVEWVPQTMVTRMLREPTQAARERYPWLLPIVGDDLLDTLDRLILESFRAGFAALQWARHPAEGDGSESSAFPGPSPFLRARYGLVASAVAITALVEGEFGPAWAVRYLVDRSIDGRKDYLRLFATVPGADVPVDLIPEEERIDIRQIFPRYSAASGAYQSALEEARRRGTSYYPSVPADEPG
jgi:hypothetical protein